MKMVAHLVLTILAVVGAAYAEGVGKTTTPAADVPPWVKRLVPGGKSLPEIFNWFNSVELVGESTLSLQLRRANEKSIHMDEKPGSRAWEYISPTKPVVIKSGEQRHIWVEGVGMTIGVDKEIFSVEGCSWLSNAVHKIYVRWSQGHEFNKTTDQDKYVISPDLKKAFYLEGGKDVEYPFPFVNAKPNLSAEEIRDQQILKDMEEFVVESTKSLLKAIGTVEPAKRYSVKMNGSKATWFAMFEDNCRSVTCAKYNPSDAQLMLFKHCSSQQFSGLTWIFSDGEVDDVDVVDSGKVKVHEDDAFKLAFAREVLNRLKLTAADLPDIKLDGILAAPEAK